VPPYNKGKGAAAPAAPVVQAPLSVVCLSVTLVRLSQAFEIFGNFSMLFGTLAIY